MYFVRSNTLLLCISLLCIYLLYCTDPQTHRLDCFLKFPELSGQAGISRNPSKNANRKITNLSGNTLLLIWFHKHFFTPYPSLSGQVGISSIHSKNADKKLPIFLVDTLLLFRSHKHSLTPYPSLSPFSPMDGMMEGGINPCWAG